LNSRPLPYQGSALPLSYASLKPTLQSYRERSLPNTTRKAKNASRIRHRSRYLPGSIVLQALADSSPSTTREITIRPLPAGLKSTLHQPCKSSKPTPLLPNYSTGSSGAQGRIRTSVTQRVADLQSAAINHSATCAHPENHANPQYSTLVLQTPLAPHAVFTAIPSRRVEILEEWWSAARQNDPQIQPNPNAQNLPPHPLLLHSTKRPN
jgi:hypothetical protein